MDKKTITEYIRNLDNIRNFLEKLLDLPEEINVLDKNKQLSDFTSLRFLAKSLIWPEAVPQDYICGDGEEEKIFRANEIINESQIDVSGLNFLDFGCGEGYVAFEQSKFAKKSVGYDIKNHEWNFEKENLIFSKEWKNIEDNGPYDVIFCYDVLDHVAQPLEELKKIQKVKTPQTGKVVVRLHPWTSRHGSHLYKQINKAYIHLIFSEDELFTMGIEQQKMNKILDPINFYKDIFKQIGFTVLKEEHITQTVENFFVSNKQINERIQKVWNRKLKIDDIIKIMEIQFIDFTLI